jgi:hypothetical protein
VVAVAPVMLPVTLPIKPLVEVTGPLKVVLAIITILTCDIGILVCMSSAGTV